MTPRTFTALLTGMVGLTLSACATSPVVTDDMIYPATLSDVNDSATRNLIRTYVLVLLGPGYTVDLDQLSQSPQLIARDNGRSQVKGQRIPVPDRLFLLEISLGAEGATCALKPDSDLQGATALILPPDVGCDPVLNTP